MLGEPPHVHFVDHALVQRAANGFVSLPIIVRSVDDDVLHSRGGVVTETIGRGPRPVGFASHTQGIRIQKQFELIEAFSPIWAVGTIHPVGVCLPVPNALDKDMPVIEGPVFGWVKGNDMGRGSIISVFE